MKYKIKNLSLPDGVVYQISKWEDSLAIQQRAEKSAKELTAVKDNDTCMTSIKVSDEFSAMLDDLKASSSACKVLDDNTVKDTITDMQYTPTQSIDTQEEYCQDCTISTTEDGTHTGEVFDEEDNSIAQAYVEEVEEVVTHSPNEIYGEDDDIGLPGLLHAKTKREKKEKLAKKKKEVKPKKVKEKNDKGFFTKLFVKKENQSDILDGDYFGELNEDTPDIELPSLHGKPSLIFDDIPADDETVESFELSSDNVLAAQSDDYDINSTYKHSVTREGFVNISIGGKGNE